MVNITNITPSFFGIAEAVRDATNWYFFPTSIIIIGMIFVMRYLDIGYPIDWVMVVALFITSLLSVMLNIINLVPIQFVYLNVTLFAVFTIWAALTKQR